MLSDDAARSLPRRDRGPHPDRFSPADRWRDDVLSLRRDHEDETAAARAPGPARRHQPLATARALRR